VWILFELLPQLLGEPGYHLQVVDRCFLEGMLVGLVSENKQLINNAFHVRWDVLRLVV
jgi:hypothetical protein